jgi:hypothetical protein
LLVQLFNPESVPPSDGLADSPPQLNDAQTQRRAAIATNIPSEALDALARFITTNLRKDEKDRIIRNRHS